MMGFPLPHEYCPLQEDFKQLIGTHLVMYDRFYFLVDGLMNQHYDDFIWNVCRSYVALGYLPPAIISDVQGDKNTLKDEDVLVIAACKTSLAMAKTMYEKALSQFCKRFGI
jgi:hypothetical protein